MQKNNKNKMALIYGADIIYQCLSYIVLFNIHNSPNRQELIAHLIDEELRQIRNLPQSPSGKRQGGAESQLNLTKVYVLSVIL